ncbi:SGNH/GDSL hydrolase family protein [Gordonia sp. VNQ95]|uniref:SGNH/GDSL hydrolase family protein n=1 Tax=Gordonia sp. VNQ95 TaxID=3156619 RepID=UPI0032B581B9
MTHSQGDKSTTARKWAGPAITVVAGAVVVASIVGVNVATSDTGTPASQTSATETATTETSTTETSTTETSASPTSGTPAPAPATESATRAFTASLRADPTVSKTLVLLGDATGSDPNGWAPQLGTAIATTFDKGVATKFWDESTSSYGPMIGLGNGPNGKVGFWNGSAAGLTAAYAVDHLDGLIAPDVTPNLIMLDFGHTENTSAPLAPQLQPLIDALRAKYPNAKLVAFKQNPQSDGSTAGQLEGFAAAMDAQGIEVIDVYSAFPTDEAQLNALLSDGVYPNAEGQKIWATTVLNAFGLSGS